MNVEVATKADFKPWLVLAAEVEPLFGPMVAEPAFLGAIERSIARGSGFCVREGDAPPGVPLLAALLWSSHPPSHQIGWLAVAGVARRRGLVTLLVRHALSLVCPPAEITVKTFREDSPGGAPARLFYARMGFLPAALTVGPNNIPVQVFRLILK